VQDFRFDVDPSLCSKQRQLKRAKLADSLASQLSHRPGPLELIQKNILHTDDPVEQLVKQGSIPFTPTAEGVPCKPVGALAAADGGVDDDSSDTAPSPLAPGELVSGTGIVL
jgi:MKL/myocardin-like protein